MSAPASGPESGEPVRRLPRWMHVLVGVGAVVALFVLARQLSIAERLPEIGGWIRDRGALGGAAFGALFVLATLVGGAVPLSLAAGAIWGVPVGVALVSPASVVGATVAFLLGRFAWRDSIEARVKRHPRFDALESAVAASGFRVVALLRLSPILPFSLMNYALGVTRVSLLDYVLGSFVGMLPGTIVFVYLGHAAGDVGAIAAKGTHAAGTTAPTIALVAVGLVATVVVAFLLARMAKKALPR